MKSVFRKAAQIALKGEHCGYSCLALKAAIGALGVPYRSIPLVQRYAKFMVGESMPAEDAMRQFTSLMGGIPREERLNVRLLSLLFAGQARSTGDL